MKHKAVNSDERTRKNTGTAAIITLALVWVALLGVGIYKTVKYGVESTTEEILIFLGSLLVFLILKHRKDDVDLPATFFGKPLPTGLKGKDKKVRVKAYIVDSLLNSLILTTLNITLNRINPAFNFTVIALNSPFLTILINAVVDLAVLFTVFMLLNYFWGEHNVKKFHKMMEE